MMIEKDVFMESGYPKQYFEVEMLDEGMDYIPPTPTPTPTPTINLPFEEEITLPVDNIPSPSPIPPKPKLLPEDFIKLIREEDLINGGGYISNQPIRPAPIQPPIAKPVITNAVEKKDGNSTITYAVLGLVAISIGILIFKK